MSGPEKVMRSSTATLDRDKLMCSTSAFIVVGGGKGGVGKTMSTMSTIDMFLAAGLEPERILVIESDTSNPDVAKALEKTSIRVDRFRMDEAGGYIEIGKVMEEFCRAEPRIIVVNTPASITEHLVKYEPLLREVATALSMRLCMLWPINRQRDSLELLKNWFDATERTPWLTVVLKNTYFGSEKKFTRYDSGKLKQKLKTAVLPDLNDLIADRLIDERLPLWEANPRLSIVERAVLTEFRQEARKNIGEACYGQ